MQKGNILAVASVLMICSGSVMAEQGAIKVKESDVAYFDRIDQSFTTIASVAGECSSSEVGMHACICEEASALEDLESALDHTVQNKPEWEDRVIVHEGVNYNLLGLRNQAAAIRAIGKCGA
jgi:hypothetical protein